MKKWILLFIFCFSFYTFNANAQNNPKGHIFFNITQANEQLNIINELDTKNIQISQLASYIERLGILNDDAEECVAKSLAQLNSLETLLKPFNVNNTLDLKQADHKYLLDKKFFYLKQLSECRLYVYRSQQTLIDHKNTIQELSTHKILKRSIPIWRFTSKDILLAINNFDITKSYQSSGIDKFNFAQLLIGLLLIIFATVIAIYIRVICLKFIEKQAKTHPGITAFLESFAIFIIPLAALTSLRLLLGASLSNTIPIPEIMLANNYLLLFTLVATFIHYLFHPSRIMTSPINLSPKFAKSLYVRSLAFALWVLVGYLIALAFRDQPLSIDLAEPIRMIFMTILGGLAVWFFWAFSQSQTLKQFNHFVIKILKIILCISLLSIITIEWLGFHQLAVYLITSTLFTFGLFTSASMLWYLTSLAYLQLDNNRYFIARKIRSVFGATSRKKINEIIIIKFAIYFVILTVFSILLMKVWKVSENLIDSIVDGLWSGFTIVGLPIIPSQLLFSVLSFAIIMLIGRFIATTVTKRQQYSGEKDTQVAVASIITYSFFTVALLFALLITGINFTSLAIIAGALSVGIGLGLQNIVNNFISGIILLLEKPVKPGDRVIIGGTEGFIKKIRIRSTQVTTLAKEDVIIPNADLITNQVTNYMFRDHHWRVTCQVGVAYGSDIKLVKKVLLDVAAKHPDVIQEEPSKPIVLFRQFGDSSLQFELLCVIDDVNKKFTVVSDLNFAIDNEFKQQGISIAFPQLDIHIKKT